jgi:asparagine synthase (glutamine-hydrolysing)
MSAPRFFAAAGQPDDVRRCLSSLVPPAHPEQRLNREFDGPDLVVYASPETPLVGLAEERGLIVGRLFLGTAPSERAETLSLSESRHAAWSGGRSLLESKWGGYVAFLRDDSSIAVLRDPSGAVPVYHRTVDGVHLYSSHPELLGELGLDTASIDEEFLRQWLTYPFLRTQRTGALEWRELLPGSCRRSQGAAATIQGLWSPWQALVPERAVDDFDEAARRLRETAIATVPIQLAGVQRPILELSGGLDSSIVGACLKAAGVAFSGANFVTIMPDGDERDYARLAAAAVGVELAELRETERPLDLTPPATRTLRPPLSPVLRPLHHILAEHARATRSNDFVTGAGGDNVFCYITTAAPILDAVANRGLRGTLETLSDVATLGECTIWKAGRYAVRKRIRRKLRPRWARDERFLASQALVDAPHPHPWLEPPIGTPIGKIEHVDSLVRVQHFLEAAYPTGEAVHHPLLAQPLVELCLAIPTWLWVHGGRNRAVARAAFAGLLPPEIVGRRTKGRLESMCARAYVRNRTRLGALLLDGELSRRGLVDRRQLQAYLGKPQPPDDSYYRLFDLVSLELWLRSWRS